ncbi:LysR family transcriptional regulator [Caulobacter sp. CCUG 60055]|uniref:transcriptional regulator GcvA n=1 Tax=Caulobacter sp. CCUG 60055 TaxID=2100090 RepID=UPI001FA78763|nr:transcriptional regulator GcvA [Caulobacter sp. CCUG 60055]MBQ1540884.1 transcriptional regulator GcvA [Caulobacteraceae bacterium]MCI3179208.1 LysR family transcriptional regulator [Caulobacter sp. CCUG 60055]
MERRRLPPLNALRAFEAAARHLNFSRAADELAVTPGAVSQQIQNLEDYVGAALFKRTPKGLLLTDAAQTALPALREAFDRLAEAASMLTAAVDGRRLTVSVAPSFAAKWLVPRLGKFEEAHPHVDVWVSAGMELVDFASGEIDIAIRYGAGRYPGLEVARLMQETVIPVAAPELLAANPLNDIDELAGHILLHDGSPDADDSCPDWTMWLAARGIRGVDGARGPRFNQSSLVIEAAVNGRGVALAKRALAQADLDAGRLVAPFQIATAVDFAYYVVHPKAKGRLPQVKAFVSWLTAEAQAHEAALLTIDNGAGI